MLSTFSRSGYEALLYDFCFPWALFQLISVQGNVKIFKVTASVNPSNMKVHRRVSLAKEHLHLAFILLFF